MTLPPDLTKETKRLQELHEARVRAELDAADGLAPGSDAIRSRGALLPEIAVVKGLPGPAEVAGGQAVSGEDGEAVLKALARLGHNPEATFFTLSRPEPGLEEEKRRARLRLQLEAVDAPLILALDPEAAEDVARAFGLGVLPFGQVVEGCGRRFVALEGLEASLANESAKRRVWSQLSVARPLEASY